MSSDPATFLTAALLSASFGVTLLLFGVLAWRSVSPLADRVRSTPLTPLGSVADGPVAVAARVVGEGESVGPVTRRRCAFFHLQIDEVTTSDESSQVGSAAAHAEPRRILLEHGPGRAQVDLPEGGARSLRRLRAGDRSEGVVYAFPQLDEAFTAAELPVDLAARVRGPLAGRGPFLVFEVTLAAGDPVVVLGTAVTRGGTVHLVATRELPLVVALVDHPQLRTAVGRRLLVPAALLGLGSVLLAAAAALTLGAW